MIAVTSAGVSADAQSTTVRPSLRGEFANRAGLQSGRDPGAYFLEALGGTAGSLLGMGLIGLASHCGVDDLACLIETVGAAGAAGVLGSTIGVSLVARATGSRRSIPGAVIGAVVGTGFGLGVHYVLNKGSDRNLDDVVVIPIFTLSQGTIAALGSRLLGK
jgi:hypothetical protein